MADEKPTVTDKASPLEMEKVKHSSLEYAVQHDGPAYRQRAAAPYKESALPELTRGEAARSVFKDRVSESVGNALGAAKGDRVSLGVEAENASSDITATDDKDVNAEVDLTVVALTLDADGRVTSAIGDMAEPALTIAADGGVTAPDTVRSKLELGDSYGMRNASSLGKEWYEHSEGYCSYLKGKTEKEVADIPADGSDADLAALCTISIDALQKAAGDAFENASL